MTHDYSRKRGIVHTEILLPKRAPPAYADRSTLWNAVEQVEKNGTAQLSREINLALPAELSASEQKQLVREYCTTQFTDKGMCADIAIHDTGNDNPHVHIMLTMRPFREDGTWDAKQRKQYILDEQGQKIYDKAKRQYQCRSVPTTDWNEQSKAEIWRAAWAETVNRMLEKGQRSERIDHRSYECQGVDQIPTVHMGVAATQMERRGIRTEKGDINREIMEQNRVLKELKARITRLYNWSKEDAANDDKPSILAMLNEAGKPQRDTRYAKTKALKDMAKLYSYMQANNISSIDGVYEKIAAIQRDYYAKRGEIVAVERSIAPIRERLNVWEQYEQNRSIRKTLDSLPERKRAAFAQAHSAELLLFDRAAQQLDEWKAAGEAITPKK